MPARNTWASPAATARLLRLVKVGQFATGLRQTLAKCYGADTADRIFEGIGWASRPRLARRGRADACGARLVGPHLGRPDVDVPQGHGQDAARRAAGLRGCFATDCNGCQNRGPKRPRSAAKRAEKLNNNAVGRNTAHHVMLLHTAGVSGSNPLAPTNLRSRGHIASYGWAGQPSLASTHRELRLGGTVTNLLNLVLPVTKSRVTQNSSRPPWKTPENHRPKAACLVRLEAPYVSDGFDFQYRVGVSFDANACLSPGQSARWASRYPCKACQ